MYYKVKSYKRSLFLLLTIIIVRLGPSPKPKFKEKGLDQSRTLNSHSTHHHPSPTTNFLTSSRQPRRVKFDMEAQFNPTKRNLKKGNMVT